MSRRFGRKQRRAAREMIAALEDRSLQQHEMFLREVRRRQEEQGKVEFLLGRIRHWDTEIRALLGPYTSFAIDDTTFRVDHPDQVRQLPVIPPAPSFIGVTSLAAQESLAYYIETMLAFVPRLDEDDLMTLRRYLSVTIKVGDDPYGGKSFCAISESMWRDLKRGGPDVLQRMTYRIARDLVRLLAEPKKKEQHHAHVSPA